MNQSPSKLAVPLAPLVPRLELDADGQKLLAGVADAATAIDKLLAADRAQDAVRLIAHALPKREAVWWACMCARSVPDAALPPEDRVAIDAAEGWVRKPDEAARRACQASADKTKFASPEAWAAMGAFWSGGSMSPEGQPVVPPAETLTGTAVTGAVILASVRHEPPKQKDRLPRFIASARDIAVGGAGRLQPEDPPPAPAAAPPPPPPPVPPKPPAPPPPAPPVRLQ
ncbi:hypothetical protein J5Y09_11350 [Roseomonas sp. PWR1]|uniref:Secreted protein n=1 Tax=Roseomonas nitratireducens TaxID=2820810 RepID=A0ABS4AVC2_9PROT|nr:hypothetical protein [Neoroseomonas nitratireducens]MBP0464502.1 hypothetical protein [Neoroseomonas nitratireducens]